MNLIMFAIIILVSIIIVKIGAVALELTGLEPELSYFQAVSCFTGTGFTTRESELITANPQRRRIATILMIIGFAGVVTLIATFANFLRIHDARLQFPLSLLSPYIPEKLVPWVNLIAIIVMVYLVWKLVRISKLVKKFDSFLKKRLQKNIIRPVNFHELMLATGGYGVVRVEIREGNPNAGRTLDDLKLRENHIHPLALERAGKTTFLPGPETRIGKGDALMCFGFLEHIRRRLIEGMEDPAPPTGKEKEESPGEKNTT